MKLKVLIAALVIGALGAAVAFAAPPPGTHGKRHNSGLLGPSGPSGPHGKGHGQGNAGPVGASGPTGPSGPHGKGHHFGNGPLGPTGPSGPHGRGHGHENAGPTGASGPKGPTGASGASGASGPHGNKCPPKAVVLKGTLNADVGSGTTVSITVTGGNAAGQKLKGQTVNISTPNTTPVATGASGPSTVASLHKGDKILVLIKENCTTGKTPTAAALGAVTQKKIVKLP